MKCKWSCKIREGEGMDIYKGLEIQELGGYEFNGWVIARNTYTIYCIFRSTIHFFNNVLK